MNATTATFTLSTTTTTASRFSVATAYASGCANIIAERARAPFVAIRARRARDVAAYNAAVAGNYVMHFLMIGLALNTDRFADTAARYARRAWREAVASLGENS